MWLSCQRPWRWVWQNWLRIPGDARKLEGPLMQRAPPAMETSLQDVRHLGVHRGGIMPPQQSKINDANIAPSRAHGWPLILDIDRNNKEQCATSVPCKAEWPNAGLRNESHSWASNRDLKWWPNTQAVCSKLTWEHAEPLWISLLWMPFNRAHWKDMKKLSRSPWHHDFLSSWLSFTRSHLITKGRAVCLAVP